MKKYIVKTGFPLRIILYTQLHNNYLGWVCWSFDYPHDVLDDLKKQTILKTVKVTDLPESLTDFMVSPEEIEIIWEF